MSSATRRRLRATAIIAFGVLMSAIAWVRLPAIARDTLWAEDGRTFLGGAASITDSAGPLTPYAGYLHLLPRMEAAAIVHLVPVSGWAVAMTLVNCAVAGAVSVAVLVATRDIVSWVPGRALIAALTVLTPLGSREVLGNAANVHSLLLWAGFWLLVFAPRGRWGSWALAPLLLLVALTEIQCVILLPLLLWRWRSRMTRPGRIAFLAGVAAQLTTAVVHPRAATAHGPVPPVSVAQGWLIDAVAPSFVPRATLGSAIVEFWPLILLLASIPLAAVVIVLLLGSTEQRLVGCALLGLSVLVWAAGVVANPAPWYDYAHLVPAELEHLWLSRYGVVPGMALLAVVPLSAAVLARRSAGEMRVAIAVCAILALLLAVQAPSDGTATSTRRSSGPTWSAQIPGAEHRCRSGAASSVSLRETLGWRVVVPCRWLTGSPAHPHS